MNVELVAVQLAVTSAVTLPATSTLMLLIVTPLPVKVVAVTFRVFAAWTGSLTVAICEDAVAPCCLESGAAAVMLGWSTSAKQTVTSLRLGDTVLSVVLSKA